MSPESPAGRPDVFVSEVDPAYECVRVAPGTAVPPPGGTTSGAEPLCPDGWVPRRRRPPYEAEGKVVRRPGPPERNPSS